MKSKGKIKLLLILIITAGFLLRLYRLPYESVWYDEAFSVHSSQQSLKHILNLRDTSPPFYYILLHFVIKAIGISEFNVRLLSVFIGTITIYLLYVLGKKLFGINAGIFAALILALSPLHHYYSQEARSYALLFLLVLTSMYFYLLLCEKPKKTNLGFYLISSVLLLYTHIYSIFIVLAQNVHYFYRYKFKIKKIKKWVILQIILLLLYLPWIFVLKNVIASKGYSWISKPTFFILQSIFYTFFAGEGFSIFGMLLTDIFLIIILMLLLNFKKKIFENKDKFMLLLLWFLIPIFVPFTFSLISIPIFTLKYVIISSFPVYLLIGLYLSEAKIKKSLTALIIIFSIFTIIAQSITVEKDDWKSISKYLNTNVDKNEAIVVIDDYEALPLTYYYKPICFPKADIFDCVESYNIYPTKDANILKNQRGTFWLVLSNKNNEDKSKYKIDIFVNQNYKVLSLKEYSTMPKSKVYQKLYYFLRSRNLINYEHSVIKIYHLKQKNN